MSLLCIYRCNTSTTIPQQQPTIKQNLVCSEGMYVACLAHRAHTHTYMFACMPFNVAVSLL